MPSYTPMVADGEPFLGIETTMTNLSEERDLGQGVGHLGQDD